MHLIKYTPRLLSRSVPHGRCVANYTKTDRRDLSTPGRGISERLDLTVIVDFGVCVCVCVRLCVGTCVYVRTCLCAYVSVCLGMCGTR